MKTKVLLTLNSIFILALFSFNADAQYDYGSQPDSCKRNYSLYKEFVEQKNYLDAYKPWTKTREFCPKLTYWIYKHGVDIIGDKISKAKDDAGKKAWIDSLMQDYDNWLKYFGEDGSVYGEKGTDAYKYGLTDVAYESLKKCLYMEKDKARANPINDYFLVVRDKINNGSLDTTAIFDAYDMTMDILEKKIPTLEEKYRPAYETAKSNIENVFVPFATCEMIEKIFGKRIDENPNDTNLLKKTIQLMEIKTCQDSPLYGKAAKMLFQIKPSATAAAAIARKEIKNENTDEALKYYDQAVKLQKNADDLAQYYYEMAQIYYVKKKDYDKARSYAQKAIATKSGWGQPYLLIGDMYYSTSSSCGSDDCTRKYGYWAAEDKYNQAKSVDPSVSNDANERISKCKNLYPEQKDCFFLDIKEGQEVQVGGWIQEKTHARYKK